MTGAAYGSMGGVTQLTTESDVQNLTAPGEVVHVADAADAPWWRDAVIYQVYPRSWADADGDGIGDLPGITARLPYLRDLGVDAVWLSPFYVSPMNDAGYDVADYRDIDPRFGALADADAMVATAHELGLKVLVDLVPNHTSSEHAWFRAALAAGPGSAERERYIFRDGRGPDGEEPPNNWPSVFGGRGWTRVTEADGTPGQWYLHIFDVTQPDLNWKHPEVVAEFHDILRFWADRGVDGFRVDVAHGLVKREGLPDWHGKVGLYDEVDADAGPTGEGRDAEQVHSSPRARCSTTRPPVPRRVGPGRRARDLPRVARRARRLRRAGPHPLRRGLGVAGPPAGPLRASRRDAPGVQLRLPRRPLGRVRAEHRHRGQPAVQRRCRRPHHVGAVEPRRRAARVAPRLDRRCRAPTASAPPTRSRMPALGLRRARAATALMLALPGGAYIYQGEELGLPELTELPAESARTRRSHRTAGRDRP